MTNVAQPRGPRRVRILIGGGTLVLAALLLVPVAFLKKGRARE